MVSYLDENISIGYKVQLSEEDAQVVDRRLYHGRLGGVFDEFLDIPMYFYAQGELSSVFSEHIYLNGDTTWELAGATTDAQEYYETYLKQAPVVLLCQVTIERPVILDMDRLLEIAKELHVAEADRDKFVADFEDSDTRIREQVFCWARRNGYDGAIIANDMTPEAAGGDWCFRTSYVAFAAKKQVCFTFESA